MMFDLAEDAESDAQLKIVRKILSGGQPARIEPDGLVRAKRIPHSKSLILIRVRSDSLLNTGVAIETGPSFASGCR
jgi:hypothetical protein